MARWPVAGSVRGSALLIVDVGLLFCLGVAQQGVLVVLLVQGRGATAGRDAWLAAVAERALDLLPAFLGGVQQV
jgi:hypothetical protein